MANGRTDMRLATGWHKHLKTRMLRRSLGADGPLSLLALWSYAAENHKDGSLKGLSDDQIEEAADWPGSRGAFVAALREIGWLDGAAIHDWADEQPWIASTAARVARAKRAGEARAAGAHRVAGRFQRIAGGKSSTTLEITSGSPASSPAPIPIPIPSPMNIHGGAGVSSLGTSQPGDVGLGPFVPVPESSIDWQKRQEILRRTVPGAVVRPATSTAAGGG